MDCDFEKDDIWCSGIFGLVVGDALGVPVQFMSEKEINSGKKVHRTFFLIRLTPPSRVLDYIGLPN